MSNSDSESDSAALEAFERRFAGEWDSDLLIKPGISAPTVDEQNKFKSTTENYEDIVQKYGNLQLTEKPIDGKPTGGEVNNPKNELGPLYKALVNTFSIDKQPLKSNIPNYNPGRDTILLNYSGSHFSPGPKIGMEKLLVKRKYSKVFVTFMQIQLMQDIETINKIEVDSMIEKRKTFSPVERRYLAKYLLFLMSVCQKEKLVDTIYERGLYFVDMLNLGLQDFLDVFNNWGIPKELLQPPFTSNESTPSTPISSPEANFEVPEYNVFKVLDYIVTVMNEDVRANLQSRLIVVRALVMIYLDKRFAVSFECYKFEEHIRNLVFGIDTDDALYRTLNFSQEHMHNEAWVIKKFLEGRTDSMRYVGRYVGTQFLLRMFHQEKGDCPSLTLCELYHILQAEVESLSQLDIYTAHVIFLVIESYITTYDTTEKDKEIIEKIIEWSQNMYSFYSDDCHREVLDRHIIMRQLKMLPNYLNDVIGNYGNPGGWEDLASDNEDQEKMMEVGD